MVLYVCVSLECNELKSCKFGLNPTWSVGRFFSDFTRVYVNPVTEVCSYVFILSIKYSLLTNRIMNFLVTVANNSANNSVSYFFLILDSFLLQGSAPSVHLLF